MSNCCIGFGNLSYFYIYILGSFLFNCLKDLLLSSTIILKDIKIAQNLYKYFGFFTIGFLLYIKFKKNTKKQSNSVNKESISSINLIHNKSHVIISKRDKYLFFLICFIYVFYSEGINILNYFEYYSLEFWTFDIIFILIFMNYYFPDKTYKHQTYSMLFIIIFDSLLLVIASNIEEYFKEIKSYDNIFKYKGFPKCFLAIIIFIDITFFISFSRIKSKILMDIKFISPYFIILYIGIFGFILNLIICIYFLIKGNNKICNYKETEDTYLSINIFCYGNISYYFTSFKALNTMKIFREIILTILFLISFFISFACEFLIIKYLNPNYILMSDNIYFEIVKIKGFFGKVTFKKFLILQIAELLEFIGCAIYLEIFELRFWGLNKNLKREISERGKTEVDFMMQIIEESPNKEDE